MSLSTEAMVGLKTQIDEMMESSVSVKGEAFANVAAGLFELQQLSTVIASILLIAKREHVDIAALAEAAGRFVLSASARMMLSIPKCDVEEAVSMARALDAKRLDAIRKDFGA